MRNSLRSFAPFAGERASRTPVSASLSYTLIRISAAGFLAALVVLAVIVYSAAAQAKAAPESFANLAEKLLPAVVNISTTQVIEGRKGPELPQLPPGSPFEEFFKEFFDRNRPKQRQRRATSLGSGFIIDAAGHIATNNHVIQDADEITVILQDNTRLSAEIVGRDAKTDIAVLKVKPRENWPTLVFGDSDLSRVGDWVLAIGNPFGLGGTVTAGIISARGRDINAGPYDDFLQTDASINRGNSGGPMFNLEGEVIGINTAIFSPSGGSVGIGFAIPSAVAKTVIRQLVEYGQVHRGWLGVRIQAVTEEIAESLGLTEARGALVATVIEGGPAEKAEIRAGDVVLKFDGREVPTMRRLPRIVADTRVGKPVEVVIWRDNREITLEVVIGEVEEDETTVAASTQGKQGDNEKTVELLGLTLSPLTENLRKRFNVEDNINGVVVTAIDDTSGAAEKGIRVGDVIVEVGQEDVATPSDIVAKVEKARQSGRKSVLFLIEGQGGLRFVAVRVEEG